MGYLSGKSGLWTLLKSHGAFTQAKLVHISFQQVQGPQSFGADCSQQLMLGCIYQPRGNFSRQIHTRNRTLIHLKL